MEAKSHTRYTRVVPTVLRSGPYRVYFYSHEPGEPPHVHVDREEFSAKFWLKSGSVAVNFGYSAHELNKIERLIAENQQRLIRAWDEFFRT